MHAQLASSSPALPAGLGFVTASSVWWHTRVCCDGLILVPVNFCSVVVLQLTSFSTIFGHVSDN